MPRSRFSTGIKICATVAFERSMYAILPIPSQFCNLDHLAQRTQEEGEADQWILPSASFSPRSICRAMPRSSRKASKENELERQRPDLENDDMKFPFGTGVLKKAIERGLSNGNPLGDLRAI